MEGRSSANTAENCVDHSQVQCSACPLANQIEKIKCACESTVSGKRKYSASILDVPETMGSHPIDEILLWHNAIKKELNEIAVETRKIQHSGDYTNLSAFNERLQFIAEVFIFHRYHLNLFLQFCLVEESYVSSIKQFPFQFLIYLLFVFNLICLLLLICSYLPHIRSLYFAMLFLIKENSWTAKEETLSKKNVGCTESVVAPLLSN